MRKSKYGFEKSLILNVGQSFLSKQYTREDFRLQPNLDKNIREGAQNYGKLHNIEIRASIFKKCCDNVIYKITRIK